MSRLYSSPGVINLVIDLESLTSDCRGHSRLVRCGTPHAHRFAVQSDSTQILPFPHRFCRTSQSTKTRSPTVQRRRWLHQIIPPAETSTGFSRDLSSAISGFRSLCGRKQRSSLKPSRLSGPAFWNLSLGAGSRFENSGLHPQYPFGVSTGPATLDRCCRRNVVALGEYSKWFFCIPIRLYGGNFRPATARRMPARSALAGPSSVNPAAAINPSSSPLWSCPTSTTSAPWAASSRAASGTSAR
jgi:hypothetical protein